MERPPRPVGAVRRPARGCGPGPVDDDVDPCSYGCCCSGCGCTKDSADVLLRAAADERGHTRAVDRLVQARGGRWSRPVVRRNPCRDVTAIAIENTVEGCVRETWAALSAAHHARHAEDPQLRAAMQQIVADEARHAEPAWSLDAWLRRRLNPTDRALVDAARTHAVAQLHAGLRARRLPAAVSCLAGVPDGPVASQLASGLAPLWR